MLVYSKRCGNNPGKNWVFGVCKYYKKRSVEGFCSTVKKKHGETVIIQTMIQKNLSPAKPTTRQEHKMG